MVATTIIYISLAAVFALGFSFFQYLYRAKRRTKSTYIFFVLRFLSVFVLLLLLINPKITSTQYDTRKSQLALTVDNSASVEHLGQADSVRNFVDQIVKNEKIQERFDVNHFTFGRSLSAENELQFNENQTNIASALTSLQKLYRKENTAVVMVTDGNQTYGRNYQYTTVAENINLFPVVVGDTATYSDLSIENLNLNKYAFLNNRFPVEAVLRYDGNEVVEGRFEIRSGADVVFSENVNFNAENSSAIIETSLPANSIGVHTYEAEIIPLENEKNTRNNARKFAIEVIDERTSVLVLTAISHPDLGALKKAIESNEQRQVEIKNVKEGNIQLEDYQLVILYQPNNRFNTVFEEIQAERRSYLLITGTETDWRFLNNMQLGFQKRSSSHSQEIFPVINPNFNRFQFEDIGFKDFPPLESSFGNIELEGSNFSTLLYQKIEGVETEEPLLAIYESDSRKRGVLFGENIWRWRSHSFVESGSFRSFDEFFGKLVQNLAAVEKRERLILDYEPFYYGNDEILISASYFDENYQFDPGADLSIRLENTETGEEAEASLLLQNNGFTVDLSGIEASDYQFVVTETETGISERGSFTVINANMEEQFVSANLSKLQQFSDNNEESLYFLSNPEALLNDLLENNQYRPLQVAREKSVPLVDWYYLLFLLVLLLAIEWFYRKYTGLI